MNQDKVNVLAQKTELEEFFLQCIEEVRKDIVRRRAVSSQYSNRKSLKRSVSTASISKKGSVPDLK
jgi:hypothetical protein